METEDRELDIVDLCESILKKWRFIIVFMVIGILIGTCVSVGMAVNNKEETNVDVRYQKANKVLQKVQAELLESEDGDRLKEEADTKVLIYEYKEKMYLAQQDYHSNSIYYNLNGNNLCKGVFELYLDNHYSVAYPTMSSYNNLGDIMDYFAAQIVSNKVCDKIISGVYPDSAPQYIRELIATDIVSSGNLNVNIIAQDEETAKAIVDIIRSELDDICDRACEIYGTVDYSPVTEQYTMQSDMNVLNNQSISAQELIDLNWELNDIVNSMSETQLDYFNAVLVLNKLKTVEPAEELSFFKYVSKKIIAIAGIVGILLAIIWVVCVYVFSGNTKTVSDVVFTTGVVLLGSIEDRNKDDKKNCVDKLVYRIFHSKEIHLDIYKKLEIVSNSIITAMENKGWTSLCIVGTVNCQDKAAVKMLVEMLEKAGIHVVVAGDMLHNCDAVRMVNDSHMVVVCEEVTVSKVADIEQEMKLCMLYNGNICGCVVA